MTGVRVAFGREVCGSLAESSRREWLVADGLGGYAAGTVSGMRTRRYHGLLVTATAPAGATRTLALAALDAVVVIGDQRIRLATHEWVGGVDPRGHEHLATFDLDDGVPRWRYDLGPVQLEVEVAMDHGTSTVGVVHRMLSGRARLEVTPQCTWRDQHGERAAGPDLAVTATPTGFVVESAYRVDGPDFVRGGVWYRNAFHREEAARGLTPTEDLWAAGTFQAVLGPHDVLAVTASTDLTAGAPDAVALVEAARVRAARVEARAQAEDDVDRVLALAADRFVVETPGGPGAVAGYPWFGEWSRDLFTSYEGLFLHTGRSEEGRGVLLRHAASVSEGMLANTADTGGEEYNTIDGTLWFLHALGRHVSHTGDLDLAAQLGHTLEEILIRHRDGTRFGIGVEPDTGLLRGGAPGWALTWMDARVSGEAVTPRAGYPVEVQALWVNGLAVASDLMRRSGRDAHPWERLRERAVASFGRCFPVGERGLPDLVASDGTRSSQLRPNQLLAVSLPMGPVNDLDLAGRVVDACRSALSTSLGLRSLAPDDPAYRGRHRGGPSERDRAYHQGTVWPWLIGPYTDALVRTGEPAGEVLGVLDGLVLHLAEAGLGSVSETADGDAPHGATGCPFQAWSVAELLRARHVVRGA